MKSKKVKQNDLDALTQQFQDASAAMVVGFNKLTVAKDQELRAQLRSAGAEYKVVKNTLARRAAKGTPFEQAEEHFRGVTAVAFVKDDGIALSKTLTKFVKDNPEVFSFKAGIVEGKVIDLAGIQTLASLPSKEELMSKLLFLLQAPAQRLATVISAVPRNLAVVIKQASEKLEGPAAAPEATPEATPEAAPEAAAPEAAAPEVVEEAATEVTREAEPEAAVEATPEATTETAPAETSTEAAPEATTEATPEAASEPAPEEKPEAEAVPEATTEAAPEAPAEAAPEMAAEAAPEEAAPEAEAEEKPEA